jgi:hypothetical protein
LDAGIYAEVMSKVMELDPAFRPKESRLYNTTWRIFGFGVAEALASAKRKWTKSSRAGGSRR